MRRNAILLGAATLMTFSLMAGNAEAVPYAYASNQITGLTVQQYDPGTNTYSTLSPTVATTSVSDTALFTPYGISGYTQPGVPGSPSNVTQAFSGPGPAPAENTFGQAPAFTGTRADAQIGAGSVLSGGASVSNVAEAYGVTPAGTANSGNTATINFTIDITSAGLTIQLNFVNAYNMMVSSLSLGDVATASIQNTFSITAVGDDSPFFSYQPGLINTQISSQDGVPPTNAVAGEFTGQGTSDPLAIGLYNISLSSTAVVNIQGQPVPEPASLALLGSALIGLGLLRRRRASRS